jgi:type 1 glutamine amidotransferase
MEMKKILVYGGGGCHDYRSICPVLADYIKERGLAVEYVDDAPEVFLPERLAPFDVIVVYHTGGKLPIEAKRGLVEGVAAGKGFIGIHAAADSFHDSPEYLAMVGGVFCGHPFLRDYTVSLVDHEHPVTCDLEGYSVKDWEKWPVYEYKVRDEQYLLDYDSRVHVLATAVFKGITWPVAWTRIWGKGRVFYLGLGHNLESCRNAFFKSMFCNAITWVADPQLEPLSKDPKFAI